MKRWLPFPRLSVGLLVMWLLLQQSLSAGHVLLGGLIGLCMPLLLAALRPPLGGGGKPLSALRLSRRVLVDITRSNIAVAGIILRPVPRQRRAGFVRIPLQMRNPNGLAVLACIITATPGTIWAAYDAAHGILLIHVLDLVDEDTWISTIKQRYESLLLEIFP
ncbi:MAG: Na+/H+ antiporter subunit E [Dokdonella sp.]